jgi:hypothetical protein
MGETVSARIDRVIDTLVKDTARHRRNFRIPNRA